VSESEIGELVASADNQEGMRMLLESWQLRGISLNAFRRIDAKGLTVVFPNPVKLISALMEVYEDCQPELDAFGYDQPERVAGTWAKDFLAAESDLAKRNQLALDLVREARGLISALLMTRLFIPLSAENTDRQILDVPTISTIRSILLERIKERSGSLLEHPRLYLVFWSWMQIEESSARSWMRTQLSDGARRFAVLRAFIGEAPSHSGYLTKRVKMIRLDSLQRIADIEEWESWIDEVRPLARKPEEIEALNIFDRTIDRRRRGVADDYWEYD
jgi:hypothetical protein